ncbi:DUF1761 domain-containing protein [Thalassobacillus sp. CUG 92003]|uniref:DUF1761 domain-containing protein n=1 Tax=Thalassobacillus sp. CUG 92003 TaxID=2736641 RepID=UPI0015E6AEC6|nr:DUF1761 domain-containing protein [Thalassobacillus sp. CUG 92003]
MGLEQSIQSINYFAVLAAALSAFIIGGLWYSVLFGRVWMRENEFDEARLKQSKMVPIFGGAFVLSVLIAFVLALFLGPERTALMGSSAGFMVGLFWVAAALGITYLFERKSFTLFWINAGYHILTFTLMGLILGVWR